MPPRSAGQDAFQLWFRGGRDEFSETELLGAALEPGYDRATELVEHDASIMTAPQPIARIAADIGGTFTDLAALRADGRLATRKLPSTPANYADAVIEGILGLLGDLGAPASGLEEVLHGCTVATNAILEHKGAKTALLTTNGFRDVLELRRIRVPQLYDPLYEKPAASGAAPSAFRGHRTPRPRRAA